MNLTAVHSDSKRPAEEFSGGIQTRPSDSRFVGDLKLDFDARRLWFASVGQQGRAWRVFEIGINGQDLVQITPDEGDDVSRMCDRIG